MTNAKVPDRVKPKKICHYMYASPDEDRMLKRQIGKFIATTGQTMGASEALRVMLFLSAGASERQIRGAYRRAKAGNGKRL
jgi:hypothetical protein